MKEEMFNDSYYDEDFNEDWDAEKEEEDEFSFDPDDIHDKIDWIENIEDPDLLEDFNIDDMEDLEDMDDVDDQYNFDE
ncbi:MAG: hypothetical protein KFF73_06655 [Cyclobacteriaceae bacterium]|nr:hypothetical protein [Cyclobacteriaceae bacterium]